MVHNTNPNNHARIDRTRTWKRKVKVCADIENITLGAPEASLLLPIVDFSDDFSLKMEVVFDWSTIFFSLVINLSDIYCQTLMNFATLLAKNEPCDAETLLSLQKNIPVNHEIASTLTFLKKQIFEAGRF